MKIKSRFKTGQDYFLWNFSFTINTSLDVLNAHAMGKYEETDYERYMAFKLGYISLNTHQIRIVYTGHCRIILVQIKISYVFTMLQAGRSWVRFPIKSLDYFLFNLLNPSIRPGVHSTSNRNEYQESFCG
jgi:hypothetical protein